MKYHQKTILKSCHFSGVGIHSGKPVKMTVHPGKENGIVFIRTDLDAQIPVLAGNLCLDPLRATQLSVEGASVATPEHFLAALHVLGISQCSVEIDSKECPILDGSAKEFIKGLEDAGIVDLDLEAIPIKVEETYCITDGDASLQVAASEHFEIEYDLHYDDAVIGQQKYRAIISKETFIEDIAPARTYAFEHEVKALRDRGLGLGGDLENTLVISKDTYLNTPRFSNECVRHKILDIVGDLAILNGPIQAKITAKGSGHKLNAEMVHYLSECVVAHK